MRICGVGRDRPVRKSVFGLVEFSYFALAQVPFVVFTGESFHAVGGKIRAKFGDIRCRKLRLGSGF
jgi:hypothetical protein